MTVNLDGLNPRQLQKVITEASRKKKFLEKREPAPRVRAKLEKLAKSHGYSLAEVFGTGGAAVKRRGPSSLKGSSIAPKYRNPANTAETWTGRGRQPLWMAALIKQGAALESLLIAGNAASTGKPKKQAAKKAAAKKQPATVKKVSKKKPVAKKRAAKVA
ncbi:H-NS histone family protein (plasmid) [Xanthomonas citri pv. citri]|uniref:H-NS histone family protein n=1 Tax=Xanthomonas citri TaxID=346 RepID=UPI0019325778|nr:H-NS histone family protein [Xanthomonas citri]QRD62692.1 H-NS histone family protein [Xanthomonas citri pv. citri]QRD67227.1 H-NS histone family protein [Xanthomonas citri pv. citri]QRD71728.1 H-NS histone family protein [Xanthomonas citri pv. citri]